MKRILQAFTVIVFLVGCGKSDLTKLSSKEEKLVESVWELAKENPMGFTLDLETMESVTDGISVAYEATQNSFGKQGLRIAFIHAKENDNIVGGWLNKKNERYHFDSVKVFESDDLDEAIEFAKTNKQFVIYDLTNMKEIFIEE